MTLGATGGVEQRPEPGLRREDLLENVATALKNAAHQRIDADVAAGRLTADQATQRKQQVDQRIDQQMTEVAPTAPTGG